MLWTCNYIKTVFSFLRFHNGLFKIWNIINRFYLGFILFERLLKFLMINHRHFIWADVVSVCLLIILRSALTWLLIIRSRSCHFSFNYILISFQKLSNFIWTIKMFLRLPSSFLKRISSPYNFILSFSIYEYNKKIYLSFFD